MANTDALLIQRPGALLGFLMSQWAPERKAAMLKDLGLSPRSFEMLLIGARALNSPEAQILAKHTGAPAEAFETLESKFTDWCGIVSQSARSYTVFKPERFDVSFSADEVSRRVAAMALELGELLGVGASHNADQPQFVMIPILKGAFIFAADLIRYLFVLGMDPYIDFFEVSSYGNHYTNHNGIDLVRDMNSSIVRGKTVIILDDICQTGATLQYAKKKAYECNAKTVKTCVLFDKKEYRKAKISDFTVDYTGFTTGREWLSGYGMDERGHLRGHRNVGRLVAPERYSA